jgi:DHA2 family multidrug resistance protein
MTGASSLYTLSRRVSGNVAYAVLATLIDRRMQFHRNRLIDGVSSLTPAYVQIRAGFTSLLMNHGANSAATAGSSLAMVNHLINRQATMMAYNDTNAITALLALLVLPAVLLLPRRSPSFVKDGGGH